MKNKFIYGLIGLSLFIFPFSIRAYVPTNDELNSSIYNYIGDQIQNQQEQNILNEQEQTYKDLFNTYYFTNNSLDAELNYKLKELKLKQEAEERNKSWLKEKSLLDKELELIQKEKELDAQQNALQKPDSNDDLVEYMKKVTEEIQKQRKIEESKNSVGNKSKIAPFVYQEEKSVVEKIDSNLPEYKTPATDTQIPEVPQKKNVFRRVWSRIMSLF